MCKKDYKSILKNAFKFWSKDYLFGYIRCLNTHNIVKAKEAMELIDFVAELKKIDK